VDLAALCNFDYLVEGGIWVSVLEVEQDSVVEENAILRDHCDVFAETVELKIFQVLPVNENIP